MYTRNRNTRSTPGKGIVARNACHAQFLKPIASIRVLRIAVAGKAHKTDIQLIDDIGAEDVAVTDHGLYILVTLNGIEAGKDATLAGSTTVNVIQGDSPEQIILRTDAMVDARRDDVGVVARWRQRVVVTNRIALLACGHRLINANPNGDSRFAGMRLPAKGVFDIGSTNWNPDKVTVLKSPCRKAAAGTVAVFDCAVVCRVPS